MPRIGDNTVQHITSRENDTVKYVRRLASSGSFRTQEGLFFAEGLRLCTDLAERLSPRYVFCTEKLLKAHPHLATLGEECITIGESVAEKLAETRTTQGLFCVFKRPRHGLEQLKPAQGLLLCEQLQDPGNVGAVLRSAAAFDYGGVLFVGGADPFSPRALRASMGSVLRVPSLSFSSVDDAMCSAQEMQVRVYAAAANGKKPADLRTQETSPFLLMVGNEGAGLSKEAFAHAQETVCIPMHNGVESLNAAVAASVLMFSFKNQ